MVCGGRIGVTVTDTSALVALILGDDPDHDRCMAAADSLSPPMATTQACLTEALYLLHRAGGWRAQDDLWNLVFSGDLLVEELTSGETGRASHFMKAYRTIPCDYADATLLVLSERLNARAVFSLDGHFWVYRLIDGSSLIVTPGPRR